MLLFINYLILIFRYKLDKFLKDNFDLKKWLFDILNRFFHLSLLNLNIKLNL